MTKILKYIAFVIAGVVVGMLLTAVNNQPVKVVGGVYNQVINEFFEGLKAGKSNQLVIDNTGKITSDLSVTGGTLTVTTSDTATSTVTGGCFQFYATSTATAHKFQASTTPGLMISVYGTCPNL